MAFSALLESMSGPTRCSLLLVLLLSVAGCQKADTPGQASVPAGRETPVAEIPRPDKKEGTIVAFLGDSLTAGLGLPESQAYPAVIGRTLESRGVSIRVINAGVSGDTSAGGLRRVDWLLAQKPDVLVVALGANDGLRGLPVGEMESNLRQIVSKGKAAGTRVLLCGLKVPPNYPPSMAGEFEGVFPRIAKDEGVALVPFILEGVGGRPELNQPDGIHPNATGQEILAKNVLTGLEAVLAP